MWKSILSGTLTFAAAYIFRSYPLANIGFSFLSAFQTIREFSSVSDHNHQSHVTRSRYIFEWSLYFILCGLVAGSGVSALTSLVVGLVTTFYAYEIFDYEYFTFRQFSMIAFMSSIYGASGYSIFGSMMVLTTMLLSHNSYGNYRPPIRVMDFIIFLVSFYGGVATGTLFENNRDNNGITCLSIGFTIFGILFYAESVRSARERFLNKK